MTIWTAEEIRIAQLLDQHLGPIQFIESVPNEEIRDMTDVIPDVSMWAGEAGAEGATFPEYPANPHNHRYTISVDGRGPMVVVRGNTADEVKEAFEELVTQGVGEVISAFAAASKAASVAAQGLPPAPSPQAPNQFQAQAQQTFNQQPAQQFPGVTGQAPAPWQNAGAPGYAPQGPQLPQGWYKLNIPFTPKGQNPGKPGFDAIVAQYNIRKGDPNNGGQVSFQKEVKSWYCSPEVAQVFQVFQPVPANA